jgi:hypothetical protein
MQKASRQIYSEKFSLDAFATALRVIYLELAEEAAAARAPIIEPRSALGRKQG